MEIFIGLGILFYMETMESFITSEKLESFLSVCRSGKPIYIMTHDHPDPDAIASAAAIQHLLRNTLELKSRVVYKGLVERPENRSMKSYLRVAMSQVRKNLFERDITLILVDAQPGTGNHSLPEKFRPTAVFDHHPLRKQTRACPFFDVRPRLGACATLAAGYLNKAEAAIPRTLATALCYAITSETRDLGRAATEEDIETYVQLLRSANLRKLSFIEHSRSPKEYFLNLHEAVERAFAYKDIIGTTLGKVSRPDLAAQMADLLLTHERMHWSICSVVFKNRIHLSLRTTRAKAKCNTILRKVLGSEGSAGGHGMLAGGYLPVDGLTMEEVTAMETKLMLRFIGIVAPPGVENLPSLKG